MLNPLLALTLCLYLAGGLPAASRPVADRILLSVELRNRQEPFEKRHVYRKLSSRIIHDKLDVGDSLDGAILLIRPAKSGLRFKVDQRFETSMTVMNEGPHLDLRDWVHYKSPWHPLKKSRGFVYRVAEVSDADGARFPRVTRAEMRAAVVRATKSTKGWTTLVRDCASPHDYPCDVGVSKVVFRISVLDDAGWTAVQYIAFDVQMGC